MTIASTITSKQYTGNGATTQFSFPNKIFSVSDLVVTLTDTNGILYSFVNQLNGATGISYTIQNVDVDTGCLVVFSAAITNLWTIDIRSVIAETQSTSIKNQGSFLPELHEEALDRLTRELQDLYRLTYIFGIHGPDIESTPWTPLPGKASRAGQMLTFDGGGNPLLAPQPIAGSVTQALIGQLLYPTLGTEIGVTNNAYPYGNVLRFGADSTGATDSTTKIQNAATSITQAGGGTLYFPAGTYMINRNIAIGSNTTVAGEGRASLIKANPTYIGVNAGSYATQTSQLISNVNFAAAALTDHDIVIRDIAFDWGVVTIAGGGAHSIALRFVDRLTIYNVYSQNGENVTSILNCRDSLEHSSHGLNCSNAYFDHWNADQSAHVISCTGRTTSGTTNQGIQFTGQGSYGDAGATANCVVAFCELYGIHVAGNTASAIIANANGASSTIARMLSFGNHVESSDNGLVYQGSVGRCKSVGDYFKGVTQQPIFFNSDASGSPGNCTVLNPTLEDCNHGAGSALVSMLGQNNRVEDVFVFSPSGVLYALIGIFPQAASTCYLHIASAPNGTGGFRWSNSGAGANLVKDTGDFDAQPATNFPTIASAATIAPTAPISFVSGTTQINTITPPPGIKFAGGEIVLIPTGLWTTGITGNISLASTAVVNKALRMTYQPNTGTWLPSY